MMSLDKSQRLISSFFERMTASQIIAERSENRPEQMKLYQKRPDLWFTERWGEDIRSLRWSEWGGAYKTHQWDGDKDPMMKIFDYLAAGDWVGVLSASGVGKTYMVARIVYWFLDCFYNSLVIISAPKEAQLKLQSFKEISMCFNRFKRLRPYAQITNLSVRVDSRRGQTEDLSQSWQAIGFVAGIKAGEESATKAQGFHAENMLIVMEEAAGMPLPTMTAFTMTSAGSNNLILAVGNPDSQTDSLSQFISMFPAKVRKIRISADDHPNIVLGKNHLGKDYIPGAVSRAGKAMRLEKVGGNENNPLYLSRQRGIVPKANTNKPFNYQYFWQCVEWHEEYINAGAIAIDNSKNTIAIDPSHSLSGDTSGVLYGKANKVILFKEFFSDDVEAIAENLLFKQAYLEINGFPNYNIPTGDEFECKVYAVDSNGVGAGTFDALKRKAKAEVRAMNHNYVDKTAIPMDNGKPAYDFNSGRSQWLWQLSQDLKNRKIIIAEPDRGKVLELFRQLEATDLDRSKGIGKIAFLSKEEVKAKINRSPTFADVLTYWNWARQFGYSSFDYSFE